MSFSSHTIRILALGDCVGKPGRYALRDGIPDLREQMNIDVVVANVENAAHGFGINPRLAQNILDYGVDIMTSGDHIRDRREIDLFLKESNRLLKPINYVDMPGPGASIIETANGVSVGVINVVGKTFMEDYGNPFTWADEALEQISGAQIKLVDLHGEATSEKVALGWYLDGKVSAVWGTHTHVQTADEQILPQGTGYLTDLGFCGGHKSVLGRVVEKVLARQLGTSEGYLEVSNEWPQLDGCIFDIDVATGLCVHLERLQHKLYVAEETKAPSHNAE